MQSLNTANTANTANAPNSNANNARSIFNPTATLNNINNANNFSHKALSSNSSNVAVYDYDQIREDDSNGNVSTDGSVVSPSGLKTNKESISVAPGLVNQVKEQAVSLSGNGVGIAVNGNTSANYEDAASINIQRRTDQEPRRQNYYGRGFIEIPRDKLNRMRRLLERVKDPFAGLRLGDQPIIDAMVRCAEVDVEELKAYLNKNYSKPAYLPSEDEVFELPSSFDSNPEENNGSSLNRRDYRDRNLQVRLSNASYTYLSSIQRELTEVMLWQPDINAVANSLIDLAKHRPRQIVQAVAEYFEHLSKG
ncbi:MAG: hypothetical protein FD167_587 [bacterium]|nr:MAG: hypothetical protein FD167_587 [bacterium]